MRRGDETWDHPIFPLGFKSGNTNLLFLLFKKRFYLFLEREGREKEGEKYQCVVASHTPPTGDLACNPGMCPRLRIEPVTLWIAGWHSIH